MKVAARVVVILLLVAGLGILAYPGYREEHYPNTRVAREAEQRGRVPPFIPDTAQEIRLLTNLDTMENWGCFRLSGGRSEFQSRLAAEGAVRRPGEFLHKAERMFGGVPWWPSSMSKTGVDRYDLPSPHPDRVLMVGFLASDNQVCFYMGSRAG